MIEHKTLRGRIELKEPGDPEGGAEGGKAGKHGSVVGYAGLFRAGTDIDDDGEQVAKGAYEEDLPGFLNDGFFAVGHNWNILPIGMPTRAEEDDIGLVVAADFHSTKEAQDARRVIAERLEAGKSAKFSVGFTTRDEDKNEGIRRILKAKLHEVSYVTVPADTGAIAQGVKSRKKPGTPGTKSGSLGNPGTDPDGFTELRFADHTEAIRKMLQDYARRLKNIAAKHKARGRVKLSPLNRRRYDLFSAELVGIADEVKSLVELVEANPDTSSAERKEARELRAEFFRLKARSVI